MKKHLTLAVLTILLMLAGPAAAQPWLDAAQRYLPMVPDPDSRHSLQLALAQHYARNGEIARAQALIDGASAQQAVELGQRAAIGAVEGGYVADALRWADSYIPSQEPDWSQSKPFSMGSAREQLLRAAPNSEAASSVLRYLRAHGGVSPSALAYVNRDLSGMPIAVTDLYFREFAKVADGARPVDWVQLEESLEGAGEEFRLLRDRVLTVLLEHRPEVIAGLAVGGDFASGQLEEGITRYTATLLARRGRFEEAEKLWSSLDEASPEERRAYLQNQYLGGRKAEALAQLAKDAGMLEDAKVQLALFLFNLGHFEEVKELGTDPPDYIDDRIARRELGREQNVARWLAFLAKQDQGASAADSRLYEVSRDPDMPARVREQATAMLPDVEAARAACQAELLKSIRNAVVAEPEKMTLKLLILDDDIHEAGCQPSSQGLDLIRAIPAPSP